MAISMQVCVQCMQQLDVHLAGRAGKQQLPGGPADSAQKVNQISTSTVNRSMESSA
jgi:hypothetical protein